MVARQLVTIVLLYGPDNIKTDLMLMLLSPRGSLHFIFPRRTGFCVTDDESPVHRCIAPIKLFSRVALHNAKSPILCDILPNLCRKEHPRGRNPVQQTFDLSYSLPCQVWKFKNVFWYFCWTPSERWRSKHEYCPCVLIFLFLSLRGPTRRSSASQCGQTVSRQSISEYPPPAWRWHDLWHWNHSEKYHIKAFLKNTQSKLTLMVETKAAGTDCAISWNQNWPALDLLSSLCGSLL